MAKFTAAELKVMRLLWEHGEMKPAELQARFTAPIKNPALRATLTTLVAKGHATRRRVGKAYYYEPTTRPRSAFRALLGDLVDTYCGGSVRTLVLNIIRAEDLSAADLLALKELAEQAPPPEADDGEVQP